MGRTALTVRGHAGFSRYGSDIVCAAASMLAFALAEAVQAVAVVLSFMQAVLVVTDTYGLSISPQFKEG